MPFGKNKECVCKECGIHFIHGKKLSEHIKKVHKTTSIEYVIKHEHGGIRPMCKHCGGETRFVSLTDGFKKYCQADRKIAESESGRIGGKIKTQWNKGLTKHTDPRLVEQSRRYTGPGNHFHGKKHTDKIKMQIANSKRLKPHVVKNRMEKKGDIVVLDDLKLTYNSNDDPIRVRCTTCLSEQSVSLVNYNRTWRCRVCHPIGSRQQLEVYEFVKSLGFDDVESSTRSVISPYEIDVWVPSMNFGVEYHGLYWHSEPSEGQFDKNRHRDKYLAATAKGVKLMQIFSDEWINKNDVCRSMIVNSLGLSTKLNGRDCVVKEIPQPQSKEFLNDNHVSGATRAKKHFGLIHKTKGLVSVATVRVPIQKKWGNVAELARMATLKEHTVRGGASKLMSKILEWSEQNGYEGLLSYADLRFGDGKVYEKCGLELVGTTKNSYWYTDGCSRIDRFVYRAQPGKPEQQVAEENNVKAVYGCGNNVYLRRF